MEEITRELKGCCSQCSSVDIKEVTNCITSDDIKTEDVTSALTCKCALNNCYGETKKNITKLNLRKTRKLCCYLCLSVVINAIFVALIFLSLFRDFPEKHIIEKVQSPTCVLRGGNRAVCSDYSTHLYYIILLAKHNKNSSAQQYDITFRKHEGIFKDHTKLEGLNDNTLEIKESGSYFLSVQLMFKREYRSQESLVDPIQVTITRNQGRHATVLVTEKLSVLRGKQVLQKAALTDIFKLHIQDSLSIYTSHPHLFYSCQKCNSINMIKL